MRVRKECSLGSNRGLTLVELAVTLGIIAILASIAAPTLAAYLEQARKLEFQVSIVNYLRAQELYYQERGVFYAESMKNNMNMAMSKIAWQEKKRPDAPSKYRFPELGMEFRREDSRGYRIRVWKIQRGKADRQELWLEVRTDEDFNKDGRTDYYSYRKFRRPGNNNDQWVVQNQFWFTFNGCPAYTTCR